MKITTDCGRFFDTRDIVSFAPEAENVSDRLEPGDGGEYWIQEATLDDGTELLLRWYFPSRVVPRDEDGARLEHDDLLPWHDLDYIRAVDEL